MKRVAVFCGSSTGFDPIYTDQAKILAQYFVTHDIGMVYGGGKVGLMGVLADHMIAKQGEVIGVIPELLRHEEVAHADISQLIVTKKMSKRKVKISRLVDGYIALPGGFGTLDELFEALTLGQLGIEQKAIGILNTNDYFKHTLNQLEHMVAQGFLKSDNLSRLIVANTVDELMRSMHSFRAPEKGEVIDKIVSK